MPHILIESHRHFLDSKLGRYITAALSILKFWTSGGKTHELEWAQNLCCGIEYEAVVE